MSLYYLGTVFYVKLNFKLKIDTKTCNLKNMEEIIWKRKENFPLPPMPLVLQNK